MNLFFVRGTGKGATVVTPSLTGSLLPGVTRASLLQLTADHGYGVAEDRISVDEWRRGAEDGSVSEVCACGTATVVELGPASVRIPEQPVWQSVTEVPAASYPVWFEPAHLVRGSQNR